MRRRSPLWIARVGLDQRCLIKSSEPVVLPLIGDGVNEPNKVAVMGNFNVINASPKESWVTVGQSQRDSRKGTGTFETNVTTLIALNSTCDRR